MNTQSAVYATIAEALTEFQTLAGFRLNHKERNEVAALIQQHDLSRQFVADLVNEVIAEIGLKRSEEPLAGVSAPATESGLPLGAGQGTV